MRILLVVALSISSGLAHAETPAEIATKLIDAQLDAFKTADDDKFGRQFAPDALFGVSGNGIVQAERVRVTVGLTGDGRGEITGSKKLSLTAGGNATVVWFSGEVEILFQARVSPGEPTKYKTAVRFTELAVVDGGGKWHVVAAEWGNPTSPSDGDGATIPQGTKPGTLAKLVIDPKQLAFQLPAKDDTVVVFGTDARARTRGGCAGCEEAARVLEDAEARARRGRARGDDGELRLRPGQPQVDQARREAAMDACARDRDPRAIATMGDSRGPLRAPVISAASSRSRGSARGAHPSARCTR